MLPHPESNIPIRKDVNMTYLLQHLAEDMTPVFQIDRSSKHCKTPRRNKEVEDGPALSLRFDPFIEEMLQDLLCYLQAVAPWASWQPSQDSLIVQQNYIFLIS